VVGRGAWVILAALSCLPACGSTSRALDAQGGAADSTEDWQAVLTKLSSLDARRSAFSLSYSGMVDSDGSLQLERWLQAITWDAPTQDACGDFQQSLVAAGTPEKRWFLQIEISATPAGNYDIVPSVDVISGAHEANAFLKLMANNREVARYTAVAGSVNLNAAPQSEGEWSSGGTLSAVAKLEFPVASARERGCSVGGSTTGETALPTCSCERPDGSSFECRKSGKYSCCFDLEGERVSFEVPVNAGQCRAMCSATSTLLTSYCGNLQP